MKKLLIETLRGLTKRLDVNLVKHLLGAREEFPPDFDQETINSIVSVRPYTLTSPERIYALCEAVKYIVNSKIPGDIVECGVWKGGSMIAVARTLIELNDWSRNLYLFDTFEGMTEPSEKDVDYKGFSASKSLTSSSKEEDINSIWCYAPLDAVKMAFKSVDYDNNKIHFVKGKVEETIPSEAPKTISLLRLDTDWYESTKHELIHLFPRISPGGVIIIDDYGHWQGARKAVDEYIEQNKIQILLNRIDYTGRIGVVLN